MSPGPTFDRGYLALKDQLRSGRHPPGAHLEPAALGDELSSSITPVRDALHRLAGERLVEAPRNDGFRAPIITELVLRQLYLWQADLLRLAATRAKAEVQMGRRARDGAAEDETATLPDLFTALGRASGNWELLAALANACDRLASARLLEERFLTDLTEELGRFRASMAHGDLAGLKPAITAYHKRRHRIVPQLVDALQRSSDLANNRIIPSV